MGAPTEFTQGRPSDAAGIRRLAGHLALLGCTAALVRASLGSGWVLPAMLLHGVAVVSLFAPLHESTHRTAFRSRWLDDLVARAVSFVHFMPAPELPGASPGAPPFHPGSRARPGAADAQADDAPLANTRTTLSCAPLRFLMWNMPYHAEHHTAPAVPFHALPALHRDLSGALQRLAPGYTAFHRSYTASLSSRSVGPPRAR